jgi:hypothetical protein
MGKLIAIAAFFGPILLVLWEHFFKPVRPATSAPATPPPGRSAATPPAKQPTSWGDLIPGLLFLLLIVGVIWKAYADQTAENQSHHHANQRYHAGYSAPAPSYQPAPAVAPQPSGPVWVQPHSRQDGTHVPGHWRTPPNGDPSDNWSTRGNVNPYTGRPGTHPPGYGR